MFKNLLRIIIVLALAACIGLMILANPDKRPAFVNQVQDWIKVQVERSAPTIEDALAIQLKDRLKQDYQYDLDNNLILRLAQPPQLILWSGDSSRQLLFYDYADKIPKNTPYYSPTAFRVSSQYKAFLDRVDLDAFGDDPIKRSLISALDAFRKTLGSQATGTTMDPSKVSRAETQFKSLLGSIDQRAKTANEKAHALALRKYSDAIVRFGRFRVYVPGSIELLHEYRLSPDLKEWSSAGPVITTTEVKGDTTVESSPAVTDSNTAGGTVSVQTQQTVDISFKTVRKLDIIPGGWFDAGAVQYFASGPFIEASSPVWGENGEFPSMPVALIVATDPTVRIELPPTKSVGTESVKIVKVGGIEFDQSQISIVGGDNGKSILHNSNNFYVLGVISVQMPHLK